MLGQYNDDYAMKAMAATSQGLTPPTLTQRIDGMIESGEKRLAALKAVKASLDANPNVTDLLDKIAELGL